MIVPFSVSDFIDRAVQVYGDRVGVVDEPDQPAEPLGDKGRLTYREMAQLAARTSTTRLTTIRSSSSRAGRR